MTLEQLQAQRDAIPSDDALPATTTRGELAASQAKRVTLDARISMVNEASAELATLDETTDVAWLDDLNTWRKALVDELFTIKSPMRDPKLIGLSKNLTVSIRCIDRGISQFRDSGWTLENCRLGDLMIASGYPINGADPARHYVGQLPWHGSIKETEAKLKLTAQRRAHAQQRLDSALIDDDGREQQEAHEQKYRDDAEQIGSARTEHAGQRSGRSDATPFEQEGACVGAAGVEPVTS